MDSSASGSESGVRMSYSASTEVETTITEAIIEPEIEDLTRPSFWASCLRAPDSRCADIAYGMLEYTSAHQ